MSKNTSNLHNQTQTSEKHSGHYVRNQTPQKPLILAVETSGRIGSIAIALDGQILAEAVFSGPMRHSAEIFPVTTTLLERLGRKTNEIEHIYISVGPGSFTGLRIATTLAKIMHLANAVKIVAVDTLDVIAANATDYIKDKNTRIEKVATILDAKRGQFFVAVYNRNHCQSNNAKHESQVTSHEIWQKISPDSLMTASQFTERYASGTEPLWLLGEGLVYYKDKFKAEGIRFLDERYWSPKAVKVHLLGWEKAQTGQFADALTLQPAYLRRPEAEEKWPKGKIKS